jgi:transcriptional regulator with XRE-family HTH domain
MSQDKNKNPKRFLWQARQRSGLSQKVIAFLMNKKFTDEISRYENGLRLPTLQTALKLEIIYRVPIRLLFYELFTSYQWQIRERSSRYKELFPSEGQALNSLQQRLEHEEYCAYADLLKTPKLPSVEKQKVYDHIRQLAFNINKTEGLK